MGTAPSQRCPGVCGVGWRLWELQAVPQVPGGGRGVLPTTLERGTPLPLGVVLPRLLTPLRSPVPASRAGCCRPVSFRSEFLRHGVDGQEAWVTWPSTPSPLQSSYRCPWPPHVDQGASIPAARGQVWFAVLCYRLTTHSRQTAGADITALCDRG